LASLSVFGRSSNPTIVPDANITFGGSGASRTVSVIPATNQVGTVTITVFATDGTATNSDSFQLTILQINDPPTISPIGDRTIGEDVATNISFTISDPETPAANLILSGRSGNTALVPSVTFGGSGANRTVNIVPALNQSGTANITVTVADPEGLTNSTTF